MRIAAVPDGVVERLGGCSSTGCRRRSGRRCTRCRWLRPGSPLAVLDLYDRPGGQRANLASILGLFFHLTSGADTYTVEEVSRWLGESGYGGVEVKSFRTLPDLRLLIAKAV